MKIDVVMITKNSLLPCLKESVESIFDNIPVNRLIVIDAFSNDGTVELFEEYKNKGLNIEIHQFACGRGKAREIGIKLVRTSWFAFVDSDVILAKNWFDEIKRYIRPHVGAIEGNVNKQKINPKGRAYTNCTLVRTKLVKDIKIPEEMTVLEDQFIRKWIESKGYKWLKVSKPCSIHKSQSNRVRDAFEVGRMAGKYGLIPFWKDLGVCILIPIKYLKYKENPKIYTNKLIGHLRGVLERAKRHFP